jgi:hypothetical protein
MRGGVADAQQPSDKTLRKPRASAAKCENGYNCNDFSESCGVAMPTQLAGHRYRCCKRDKGCGGVNGVERRRIPSLRGAKRRSNPVRANASGLLRFARNDEL